MADEAKVLRFETNSAAPPIDTVFIRRVSEALEQGPACWLEVAGHADSRPIHGGPYEDNWHLSRARADSVSQRLFEQGLTNMKVIVRGYGDERPLSEEDDSLAHQLNRRVELKMVAPPYWSLNEEPVVEYEVAIDNGYDVALSELRIDFRPGVDSATIFLDSAAVKFAGNPIMLPSIDPHTKLAMRAWTVSNVDSALAVLGSNDRSMQSGMLAVVHNPLMPVNGVSEALALVERLPNPSAVPAGGIVDVVLDPTHVGWPELAYPLGDGWSYVEGSAHLNGSRVTDPEVRLDRSGRPWLFWNFQDQPTGPISLKLRPVTTGSVAEVVSIPALRSDEERAEEKRRNFVAGPAVEVFEPLDGTVFPSDRVYIGVRGEPGAPVALFDGDSLIAGATMRVDGVHDFIAIPLSRGPHTLRVRMMNSWQQERWDSMAVHVSGLPSRILTTDENISLVADGHTIVTTRARVVDSWGVPVVNPSLITASAEGAEPLGEDADPSSVGLQLRSDAAGYLYIALRSGHDVGNGALLLSAGEARHTVDLEILPAIRPLMVTGVGRVGVGAAPEAFGSITARGRIDDKTSVTVSYDSRDLDAGRDFFQRGYDPLEQAQYPILGDASPHRTTNASEGVFAARVERGFDWLAMGDVTTNDFSSGLTLSRYDRSLPGAVARVSTGPVTWKGFGSSTTQTVRQLQIRGAGISGPYTLEPDIRPGTDQVIIETRSLENAERVISQQAMSRFVDYQVDYVTGALLFKRPVPATDVYENPVFIVVTYEAKHGGERKAVWGVRAATDANQLFQAHAVDSLRVGATYINDAQSASGLQLAGADVRMLSFGAFNLGAELSYSQNRDSSGFATSIDGSVRLLDGNLNLSAGWMKVGDRYHNPSNLALRGGTEEVRAAGGLNIGAGELRVEHAQQTFKPERVKRQRTSGGIVQPFGDRFKLDARVAADRFLTDGNSDESQAGELKLSWMPTQRFTLWTEARHQFNYSGNVVLPDYFGGGASFKLTEKIALETQHRHVVPRADSDKYSITRLGVRTDIGFGTEAWGSYQIAGGVSGAQNAAIVGLNNRARLGSWSFNTMFERRFGLASASIADPVRALPFLQAEDDYWSFGAGAELIPTDAPYRASARGEYRDGDFASTRLFSLAGDISVNRSLAVLSRNEYVWTQQMLQDSDVARWRTSALLGVAFRPVGNDALNVLTKFEWLSENNPISGGVLGAYGDEQRLIGALEAIWAPVAWGELGGRYALRRTQAQTALADDATQDLTSWADYVGGRLDLAVQSWLGFRAESRLLIERTSHSQRWDLAPSLVFIPVDGLEAQFGYRFGDLRDPDFAVDGGAGLFATFGVRLTEKVFPTSADFWRPRFGQ
jgi:hypothetical protein